MNTDLNKTLNDFIGDTDEMEKKKDDNTKKEILNQKSGLIERVDRIFVTSDGRQLLREQY